MPVEPPVRESTVVEQPNEETMLVEQPHGKSNLAEQPFDAPETTLDAQQPTTSFGWPEMFWEMEKARRIPDTR